MLNKIIAAFMSVLLAVGGFLGLGYADKTASSNVSVFGWDGDKNAPLIYEDGSFNIRDRGITVHFGVLNVKNVDSWSLAEGYLPCFISEYTKAGLGYTISTFADKVNVDGHDIVVSYSRETIVNKWLIPRAVPAVSGGLVPLGSAASTVPASGTVTNDYVIGVDRFGGDFDYPSDTDLAALGGWDAHYEHMRSFWNDKLAGVASLDALPYGKLIDAYKATYIFTNIVKDGDELNVGENGYDRVFDHDTLGILSYLVDIGDTANFEAYSSHILDNVQYKDAVWKYALPFALYLQKTGDAALIKKLYPKISECARSIGADIASDGIMPSTDAIDADGRWTVDDWAALTGLAAYSYISAGLYSLTGEAGYQTEKQWADSTYDSLFAACETTVKKTMTDNGINYLPVSMTESDDANRCSAVDDANWASPFLFGSWAWEGYLLGAKQDGTMLSLIDPTYDFGFARLREAGFDSDTFGGFPGVCSVYNAGYGSAALRGEKYRSQGISSFIYMIENTQSGPYSWWECAQKKKSGDMLGGSGVATSGWGACPHIWGQSLAVKTLMDSLICQKADGTVIIGRGVPDDWLTAGSRTAVSRYPTAAGELGFDLTAGDDSLTLTLTGAHGTVSLQLNGLKGRIVSAGGLDFDSAAGTVTIPSGTDSAAITLAAVIGG